MLKPIKTEEQYKEYLKRIYVLMQKKLKENSKESDELETLSILVKDYENEVFPMDKPNPNEAIKFRLEQLGVTSEESEEELCTEHKIILDVRLEEHRKNPTSGKVWKELRKKDLEDSDSLEDFNNDFDESEWTW